jgi:hypothetical protein
VKTITQYVPKPIPYEVSVPATGFYLGGSSLISKHSFSIGSSGSYLKNNRSYDFGIGYQYLFGADKGGVLFSVGFKRKL